MSDRDFSAGDGIRRAPFSIEAEQAVLGAIILDSKCLDAVVRVLTPEDFYIDKHRAIYEAAKELYNGAQNIDAVTLIDMLVHAGAYQKEDGGAYIKQLAESVPDLSNVTDYANIVHEKALLRTLIQESEVIRDNAYEQAEKTRDILSDAERRLFELNQGYVKKDFEQIDRVFVSFYDRMSELKKHGGILGINTHFKDLDNVLYGMEKGDLILVGARPGMGKTSFVMNIAAAVARHEKCTVAIFSLEMSALQIASRLLSSEARVSSVSLRTGNITEAESEALAKSANALSNCKILIDDSPDVRVSDMRAKLRRVQSQYGDLGLVVVDYLQLMRADKDYPNKVNEVADITRSLKIMAKQFQVPVLVCSQLSRSPEKSGAHDREPKLSDLRDSGAIEQDADVVIFLYRSNFYGDDPEKANIAVCSVAKNRHGETRRLEIAWDGKYTRFSSLERRLSEDSAPPESGTDAPF